MRSNTWLLGTQFKWSVSELETHVQFRKPLTARTVFPERAKCCQVCFDFVINVCFRSTRDAAAGAGARGAGRGLCPGPGRRSHHHLCCDVTGSLEHSALTALVDGLPREISGEYWPKQYICSFFSLCLLLGMMCLGVGGVMTTIAQTTTVSGYQPCPDTRDPTLQAMDCCGPVSC